MASSFLTLGITRNFHLFDFFFQFRHLVVNPTTVRLDLCFTGTPTTDATRLARK